MLLPHHYRLLLSETAQLISLFYKLPLTWCFVTAVERQFRHCVCGMCIFMCLYSWMHIWRPEEGTGILLYHCLLYSFKVRSLCEPRACIFSTKWVASRPLLSSSPLASELGLQESMRLGWTCYMDPGNQSQFLMLMHECSYPLRHLNSSYEKPSSTNISRCLYSQLGFSPSTTFSNKGIGNLQLYFKTLFLRISYILRMKYEHVYSHFLSLIPMSLPLLHHNYLSFPFLITQVVLSICAMHGCGVSMGAWETYQLPCSQKRMIVPLTWAALNLLLSVDRSQWRDALLAKALRIKETEDPGLNGIPILTHQQHYRNGGGKNLEKGCEGLSELTAAVATCITHKIKSVKTSA